MTPDPITSIPQRTQDFLAFRRLLYQVVVENNYKKGCETGTDVGDSTRIFSAALQATGGTLVTIDRELPKEKWHEQWEIKNVTYLTKMVQECFLQEEIDFLFIDDEHTYPHVLNELRQLGVWVRAGGKILLHDVYHEQFGPQVLRAIMEFTKLHLLTWIAYPQAHGMAIIEVDHSLPREASMIQPQTS